jgi:hypothetical protein
VLHSCRCIVFGCLDSNPGLNSNLFICFKRNIEIGKRKEKLTSLPGLLSSPFALWPSSCEVRLRPPVSPPRPRVAAFGPAQLRLAGPAPSRARSAAQRGLPPPAETDVRDPHVIPHLAAESDPDSARAAPSPSSPRAHLPSRAHATRTLPAPYKTTATPLGPSPNP